MPAFFYVLPFVPVYINIVVTSQLHRIITYMNRENCTLRKWFYLPVAIALLGIGGCSGIRAKRLTILDASIPVEIKTMSACRVSAYFPLNEKEQMEKSVELLTKKELAPKKIKLNTDIEKSTVRITRIRVELVEDCSDAKNSGSGSKLKIRQQIEVEQLPSHRTLVVNSDTTTIEQQQFGGNSETKMPAPDYIAYIQALSTSNIDKLKSALTSAK